MEYYHCSYCGRYVSPDDGFYGDTEPENGVMGIYCNENCCNEVEGQNHDRRKIKAEVRRSKEKTTYLFTSVGRGFENVNESLLRSNGEKGISMIERIRMYRLLRKLDMVWFDRFLSDLMEANQRHKTAVNNLIDQYDQDRYMENSDD